MKIVKNAEDLQKWIAMVYLCFSSQQYYVEMACNKLFGAGKDGTINPPEPNLIFTLEKAEIAVMDLDVHHLLVDMELLTDLVKVTLSQFSIRLL